MARDKIRVSICTCVWEEVDDRIWRFHWRKTKWGFDKLLRLDLFNDTSKGYLFEDSCEFGAEVFVVKYEGTIQCLDMKKEAEYITYTWKIDNFSAVKENILKSDDIEVGELKWYRFFTCIVVVFSTNIIYSLLICIYRYIDRAFLLMTKFKDHSVRILGILRV